jgi:hypothetical protein
MKNNIVIGFLIFEFGIFGGHDVEAFKPCLVIQLQTIPIQRLSGV